MFSVSLCLPLLQVLFLNLPLCQSISIKNAISQVFTSNAKTRGGADHTVSDVIGSNKPKVIIAGGGPAGLAASILLNDLGIQTTIVERSPIVEEWSAKSYSISLNERGQTAMEKIQCLKSVTDAGTVWNGACVIDGKTGEQTMMPPRGPGSRYSIGLSRPLIVKCLEEKVLKSSNVCLKRGSGVSKVTLSSKSSTPSSREQGASSSLITVHLEDGTTIDATHVIGADGKWSKVRKSIPELESQIQICTVKSFGVSISVPKILIPDGYDLAMDKMYVLRSPTESSFYLILAPHCHADGHYHAHVSMVCFDEILEKYPWLAPRGIAGDTKMNEWEDSSDSSSIDQDNNSFTEKLKGFLEEHVPFFLTLIGEDALNSAIVNRAPSWLKYTNAVKRDDEQCPFTFATNNVALLGDAAHAMTPAIGEGCNTALESAVKLSDAIVAEIKEKGEDPEVTVEDLSAAFEKYGLTRPTDVIPIQEMSAASSQGMTRR